MGYYTSYNMDVRGLRSLDAFHALTSVLEDAGLIGSVFMPPDDTDYSPNKNTASFFCDESEKWYRHDEDMCRISMLFPEATFRLDGNGDDPDDQWYSLYKNGRTERIKAQIVWPNPVRIEWD